MFLMLASRCFAFVRQCAGPSMIPTFNQSGDVIFAEMLSPRIGCLERGDVVIAVPPQNPKLRVCKRIIGLVRKTRVVVPRGSTSVVYHDLDTRHPRIFSQRRRRDGFVLHLSRRFLRVAYLRLSCESTYPTLSFSVPPLPLKVEQNYPHDSTT